MKTVKEGLNNLEILRLGNNHISDLSPLFKLHSLKELYIQNNPTSSDQIEELRKNGVLVIATEQDRKLQSLQGHGDERFLEEVVLSQMQDDAKPIEAFPLHKQRDVLEERTLSFEDRVRKSIQRRFQSFFFSMTPWSVYGSGQNWVYREHYMKSMLQKYPFLEVPECMMDSLEFEKRKFCEHSDDARLVFISSENIACIDVIKVEGKTGIRVMPEALPYERDIEELIFEYWPLDTRQYWLTNSFEIHITEKYRSLDAKRMVHPIIIAIIASVEESGYGKTAIIGDFKLSGELKKENVSELSIALANNEGAKNVIIYGGQKVSIKQWRDSYNMNFYFASDYNGVLAGISEISVSGME